MPTTTYIAADHAEERYSVPLYEQEDSERPLLHLLWGDRVSVLEDQPNRSRVRARGKEGWVATDHLGGPSLLEVYVIDVGQGDGVLIRTPDHRHVLIDGGLKREHQPTGKNAADFVDWKFARDYRRTRIDLDAVIVSHCDADHYGGIWDLLNPVESVELDLDEVRVESFFHAGVSWWTKPDGTGRVLGRVADVDGRPHLVQLLGNRSSVKAAIEGPPPNLQGEWGDFLARVLQTKKKNGRPTPITRVDVGTGYLPGFAPAAGKASILVLGPVTTAHEGEPALPRLDSKDSKNTNGHSVLLRLDHGRVRILLTGDLNKVAQQELLETYEGRRQELAADVAKGCHHGAEDVSFEFLQTVRAAATVISSGDNEGHDHPRPALVAMSSLAGHLEPDGDDGVRTPLVYSTELARSVKHGHPIRLQVPNPAAGAPPPDPIALDRSDFADVWVTYREPTGFHVATESRTLDRLSLISGLVYGLVNVRTDGDHIMCATRNEAEGTWNINAFRSRF